MFTVLTQSVFKRKRKRKKEKGRTVTEQFTLPTYLMAEKTKTKSSRGGQRDGFESRSATLGHSLPLVSVTPARADRWRVLRAAVAVDRSGQRLDVGADGGVESARVPAR